MEFQTNWQLNYTLSGVEHVVSETDTNVRVTPFFFGNTPDGESDGQLVAGKEKAAEWGLRIENCSDHEIYLRDVTLWQASGSEIPGIGVGPFEVFRSGRHKNDMPGTFTTGVKDERLGDVLGSMSESGDKTEAGAGARRVVSDHLTVIQGNEGSLLITFPGGRKQLFETVLTLDENGELLEVCAKLKFGIVLPARKSVESETVKLIWTDCVEAAVEQFAADKAAKYGSRTGKRPSVFCTWYYYGLTVSYEDVKTNLEILRDRKLPFDVFQIDEGWEITLGEWKPNEKFPVPMKQVAEEIRRAGFRPGIWTSPFIAHETASVWQEHPEWKLRDKDGIPYLFPMNGTVYNVLDITNPETLPYFTEFYRMLTEDWGYTYHKLDFTRAAVIYEEADFFDKTITLAEAFYRGIQAIRDGMGEESYFLLCGGLYDPVIGLVDAQRTGSDVLSMWSSNVNRDGKAAPYTIKQSVMRYYMNRWWDNDPDALMVRRNENMERNLRLTYGLLTDEEVKTSVLNQFMGGGIMCSTEPLDKIDEDRLMEYRRILPVLPGRVCPLALMERTRFPGMVDVYMESMDAHFLCVVNWDDEKEMPVEIQVRDVLEVWEGQEKSGTDAAGTDERRDRYILCDYYTGEYYTDVKTEDTVKCKSLAPHGAGLYKIQCMNGEPVVVKSTGHYSMGGEFAELTMREGKLHYNVPKLFDYPIAYEILLPDGSVETVSNTVVE